MSKDRYVPARPKPPTISTCRACGREARHVGDGATYYKSGCIFNTLCYDCCAIGNHDCEGE